jgi:phytoene dehydrogenase-like protein
MFVSGPAYAVLGELRHRHGLEYRNTDDWVTASVADDGLPVVAGGAGRFVAAFRSLLGSLGVRVETDFEVDRILVTQRRAVGVEAAGRALRARRAVLASVTPSGALRPTPSGGRGRVRPKGRGRELPTWPGGAAD